MSAASPVAVEIGRRLKTARVRLGLSQYGIAGSLGIAQPTVHSWERGARLPSIESLMRVAAYLDVPITDLLPVEATMRPDLVRLPNVRAMIAAFERTVEDLRRLLLVMEADAADDAPDGQPRSDVPGVYVHTVSSPVQLDSSP